MNALAVLIVIAACVFAQSLLYRKRWDKNISLTLSFSETRATEGDRLFLSETLTNRKFLPLPWLSVKFQVSRHLLFEDQINAQVSDDFYRSDLFRIFTYQRITRRLRFECGRRGVYSVKSAEILSGDILARHKFAKTVDTRSVNSSLIVYPRGVDLDVYFSIHKQFLGDVLSKRFIQPDPFTFRGIREYMPTDTLRSVNFKATAKTGELMVNLRDYTVACELIILFNLDPYVTYPNEELYEQTIRVIAALSAYYVCEGIPTGLAVNARDTEPIESGAGGDHLNRIYETLARIVFAGGVSQKGKQMLDDEIRNQEAKRRAGREPAYILLSTCHEKEIAEAFERLRATGADALWIIPVYREMEINVPLGERVVRAEIME